jgi:hypothetical protein
LMASARLKWALAAAWILALELWWQLLTMPQTTAQYTQRLKALALMDCCYMEMLLQILVGCWH